MEVGFEVGLKGGVGQGALLELRGGLGGLKGMGIEMGATG
jgi:hypothetical protein